MWPPDGQTIVAALVALAGGCGWLVKRRDARLRARQEAIKAEADKTATAQAAAITAKNDEIGQWQRRYEQERSEHREDVARLETRNQELQDRLYGRGEARG